MMEVPLEDAEQLTHISRNPWLYDNTLSSIDIIQWKLRDECHVCGTSVRYHRDDCMFSFNQMYFAEMQKNMNKTNGG